MVKTKKNDRIIGERKIYSNALYKSKNVLLTTIHGELASVEKSS